VLRREVALKRIKPGPADSLDAMRRFLNEARIAAQLQHPNIVPVHELDWGPDARPFLTMKLIDGRHFGELIDEMHNGGPTRLRDVVEVVERLCDAVAFAHGKGVLHLDLKPKNVLVGAYGDVQLIDWGAARVVGRHVDLDERDRSDRQELTRPYSPPEQQDGARTGELEPRSDVFALGAVLVHVLTGQRPPETRPMPRVGSLAPDAPPELASIVDRATHDRIADRYPDAASLGRDLHAWLLHERVSAHDYGPVQLVDLWTRGRRSWIGLVLVSTLTVGTVGWFAVLGWRTSAVNEQRERERQGVVLAEQARLALHAGDRIEAERRAADAVALADTPEGRGLLMWVGRKWYPQDAGRCVASDGGVACDTEAGTVRWQPERVPWTCGPLLAEHCDGRGHYVVARDDSAEVWQWVRDEYVQQADLGGHAGGVVAVAWSPDPERFATADAAGVVRLWHLSHPQGVNATWVEVARLPDHTHVDALAFDGPDLLLVDAVLPRAWDLRRPDAVDAIPVFVPLAHVAWDAGSVSTLDRQGTWRSWSTKTGLWDGDRLDRLAAAAASPDGRSVAFVTDEELGVVDRQPVRPRWSDDRRHEAVVVWSGEDVVTGGTDGVVRRRDALTGDTNREDQLGTPIRALAVASDHVLALDENGTAWLLGGDGVWPGVSAIAADPQGERFALGSVDGTVRVTDAEGVHEVPVASIGSEVRALAFGPDGDLLGAAADDQTLRVFGDPPTWTELSRWVLEQRSMHTFAFSPTEDGLAVGAGPVVEVWDTSVLRAQTLVTLVADRYGADPSEVHR
jgi:WD40 repeat protein